MDLSVVYEKVHTDGYWRSTTITLKTVSPADTYRGPLLACVGLTGAAEAQKQRYSPEDSSTLEQIRNLKHGCCIVMLRYSILAWLYVHGHTRCIYYDCIHNIPYIVHMRVPLDLISAAHLPQSHPLNLQLCT